MKNKKPIIYTGLLSLAIVVMVILVSTNRGYDDTKTHQPHTEESSSYEIKLNTPGGTGIKTPVETAKPSPVFENGSEDETEKTPADETVLKEEIVPTIIPTTTPGVEKGVVTETIKPTPTPVTKSTLPTPQETIPTPTAVPAPEGTVPRDEDWVNINHEIPKELYRYEYTIIDEDELLTGAMLKSMGFYYDWDKMAKSAKNALEKYYTVDYRDITSTDPNDRDAYLTGLVYWVGESSQYSISNYMEYVLENETVCSATVVTDESLMYANGSPIIRARVFLTFESGAGAYGLENNKEYYFDAEVTVFPNTGEDRFGYGKTADYHALLFSYNKIHMLSEFKESG